MKKVLLTILLLLSVFGLISCSSVDNPEEQVIPVNNDSPTITARLKEAEYVKGFRFGFDRELIVSAKDNQGNEIDYIVKSFTNVDTGFDFDTEVKTQVLNAAGEYNIVLSATDEAGRKTEKTLKFFVVADENAPEIVVDDEIFAAPQSSVDLNGIAVKDNSGYVIEKTFTATYFDGTKQEVSDGVLTVNNGGFYNVTVTATDYSGNVGTKTFRLMVEGTFFNDLDGVIIDGEMLEDFWVMNSSYGNDNPTVREITETDGNTVIKITMRENERITCNFPLKGANLTEGDEYFAYLSVFTDKDITDGGIVFESVDALTNVSGVLNNENKSALFNGEYTVPSDKRLSTFYFVNTTGEEISVYIDYVMLIGKPVWAERRTQVLRGSKGVDDQGNLKVIFDNSADCSVNFYLAEGETAFANEKVKVTMTYKLPEDVTWVMGARGATISHGNVMGISSVTGNPNIGTEFNLEQAPMGEDGWYIYTFEAIVTCCIGAHASGNPLYGTDKPHIALTFLFAKDIEFIIKEITVTPVTEVKTFTVQQETEGDFVTNIVDMKEHVIDLGLNGNTLYMLPSVTGMQCLSAIITNDDGDVFVIDGGYNNDYQTIYHYVTELGKATIKGWFFTHPHQDHFNVFSKFIAKHGAEITVEKVYYAWSEEESWYTERKSFEHNDTVWAQITAFKNAVITCGCTRIEPVTGDVYDFGSFSFEIMYSPKNGNGTYGLNLAKYGFDPADESKGRYNVNDLSLVIKMTAGDKTLLFLGDAGVEAGKWLYDTYQGTNELEADFVQMAHHGQAGVEENVYGLIQPKYAFFNCDYAVWNNTSGKLKTLIVRGWIESLGATAYCSQLGANSVAGDNIVYIFR